MDKPFRTIDEQVALLESRGLKADEAAFSILEREGYYSVINGYKDDFLASTDPDDRYKEGADFAEIYALFKMDRQFRAILFRYITLVEATLKSVCCYQFCLRHPGDNEAYLRAESYRADGAYPQQVAWFVGELGRVAGKGAKRPKYPKDYLRHYIDRHDNVPLWVVMNNLSLGQAYKFYDFQQESVRFAVAQRFQAFYDETHDAPRRITHKSLGNAYNVVKEFRNLCAHDERLYCSRAGRSGAKLADCLEYLGILLTEEQHAALLEEIDAVLDDACQGIHSVTRDEIRARMGYPAVSPAQGSADAADADPSDGDAGRASHEDGR